MPSQYRERLSFALRSLGLASGASLWIFASHGPAAASPACSSRDDLSANSTITWTDIREGCDAERTTYRKQNPIGSSWFMNAGNGFTGVPYLLQRVLPDLAPEIWGPNDENFGRFGFLSDPEDKSRPLPLGLGIASTAGRPLDAGGNPLGEIDFAKPGLDVVTLACGACHVGQVQTPDRSAVVEGAPNTKMDVRKWRDAYSRTVAVYFSTPEKIKASAERIAAIIDAKPGGYFYPPAYFGQPGFLNFTPNVESDQRAAVKKSLVGILATFACGTVQREAGIELQKQTSYGNWNAPGFSGFSTGQQDGSGDLIFQLLVAKAMPPGECQPNAAGGLNRNFDVTAFKDSFHPEIPPFATITDIPSVWNQQARARAQWDGSVKMAFWRNIAAQLPIVGDPSKIDLVNTGVVANFLDGLPPAPYPFDVDMASAARGEALFKENCAVCHRPHNDTIYQFRDIGTDMNRAAVLNGAAFQLFAAGFQASCHDQDFLYRIPTGEEVRPCRMAGEDVITARTTPADQGYVAEMLDGVWARAPYLHNGSVPTLYHLLAPASRPAHFLRGATQYDTAKVGYAWDPAVTGLVADTSPTLTVYDTRKDGHAGTGHDRNLVVDGKLRRLDWSGPQYADALKDLIEYLKTR